MSFKQAIAPDLTHDTEPPLPSQSSANWRRLCYQKYVDFKGWDGSGTGDFSNEASAIEIQRTSIRPGAKILEIGFGNGHFLDWAREQGFEAHGTEIISELVARARDRGHNVYQGSVAQLDLPSDFDLIVAFDVLEHLQIPELLELLKKALKLLRPSGEVLARFPNGASPFSTYYQHSDVTHMTSLSPSSLYQLSQLAGFSSFLSFNGPRILHAGTRSVPLKRIVYKVRDVIQWLICAIYYNGQRVPMDPIATVVLKKG